MVEWLEMHGVVFSQYFRYFLRYRGTAIHRDVDDTGIVTFGFTILTEVSQVSHNIARQCRLVYADEDETQKMFST